MTKTKEIVEVEKVVHPLQSIVTQLVISNADDFEVAVELGGQVKKASKFITEKKELITKPLNEALKNARAMFKPFEDNIEAVEKELKGKMFAFIRLS